MTHLFGAMRYLCPVAAFSYFGLAVLLVVAMHATHVPHNF